MRSNDGLKLENQLCFPVYACAREVTKLYHPLLKELGLTYTQYVTMLALWEKDRQSVKQLGSRLFLDSGTLTPLLKKLESSGLVKRTRDEEDERSVMIVLTGDGAALQERAQDIPHRLLDRTGLSVSEARELHAQMTEVLSKIQRFRSAESAGRRDAEGGQWNDDDL